jgi:hypothetical protein
VTVQGRCGQIMPLTTKLRAKSPSVSTDAWWEVNARVLMSILDQSGCCHGCSQMTASVSAQLRTCRIMRKVGP